MRNDGHKLVLGFGAIGEFALGEIGATTLALTSDILRDLATEFVDKRELLPPRPSELHHFTSLGTAYHVIEGDNVRLSHAEYSNDQTEMERAKEIIRTELSARSKSNPFFAQVSVAYEKLAPELDAYIFCMSMGNPNAAHGTEQDILSQWRAYGQDGKGVCLTLDAAELGRLVLNTPGLRINPVIYASTTQVMFVSGILDRGLAAHNAGTANAHEATVAALVFATPLMKACGFAEEREWRLIFMPPQIGPTPRFGFHPRRDFIAPFVDLEQIWNVLRSQLTAIPALDATLGPPALRRRPVFRR
jgi:hypothetical protein